MAIEQHEVIGNTRTVHALKLQALSVWQLCRTAVGDILDNLLPVVKLQIAAARRLVHRYKLAVILHVADNPAVPIKVRRIHSHQQAALCSLLCQAAASIIHACRGKGPQAQPRLRRYAHKIALQRTPGKLLLLIGIGHATGELLRACFQLQAVNINDQTVRLLERINFILAVTVQLNDEPGLFPAIRHKAHALHRCVLQGCLLRLGAALRQRHLQHQPLLGLLILNRLLAVEHHAHPSRAHAAAQLINRRSSGDSRLRN